MEINKLEKILMQIKKEFSQDEFYCFLSEQGFNKLIENIEKHYSKEEFYNMVMNSQEFQNLVFHESLISKHEKKDIETLYYEDGKSLLSEYEYDISTIEYLLNIKVERKEIEDSCNLLLYKLRPRYLFNENYKIDLKKLQAYPRNETLFAKNFTFRYLDVIIASINYNILQSLFNKIRNNRQRELKQIINRQRELKQIIKKLDEVEDRHKNVAENIKDVLSSINSKIELPLIFDSVTEKYNIKSKKLSKAKNRIKLFDFILYKNF